MAEGLVKYPQEPPPDSEGRDRDSHTADSDSDSESHVHGIQSLVLGDVDSCVADSDHHPGDSAAAAGGDDQPSPSRKQII